MKRNNSFSNALRRIPQNCPPIWLMRQAGRYHKHYRELRKEYSFMDLCKRPDLAAKTALGPIQDFDFDAAIVFSDLLFPLEGLGLGLRYQPAPKIERLLTRDVLKKTNSIEEITDFLSFQSEAVAQTRRLLPENKSLVGFVGGLWTLFCYAVEGKCSGSLSWAKECLIEDSFLFQGFCEKMLPVIKHCISAQLANGAEIVFIFDTAAGHLSKHLYQLQIGPALADLSSAFPYKLAYFAKGGVESLYAMECFTQNPWAGFIYDSRWSLETVLKESSSQEQKSNIPFIQGNFDPALMLLPPDKFQRALEQFLNPIRAQSLAERAGWICSLGHGVLQNTPEENVRHFVRHTRSLFNNSV